MLAATTTSRRVMRATRTALYTAYWKPLIEKCAHARTPCIPVRPFVVAHCVRTAAARRDCSLLAKSDSANGQRRAGRVLNFRGGRNANVLRAKEFFSSIKTRRNHNCFDHLNCAMNCSPIQSAA